MPMSVAEFKKFVADEIAKYAKVMQFAGINAEQTEKSPQMPSVLRAVARLSH